MQLAARRRQTADGRRQMTEDRGQGVSKEGGLERIFAILAITVGGHGQAEGMCAEMGHAAEKVHGLFRVSFF